MVLGDPVKGLFSPQRDWRMVEKHCLKVFSLGMLLRAQETDDIPSPSESCLYQAFPTGLAAMLGSLIVVWTSLSWQLLIIEYSVVCSWGICMSSACYHLWSMCSKRPTVCLPSFSVSFRLWYLFMLVPSVVFVFSCMWWHRHLCLPTTYTLLRLVVLL